MALRLRMAAAVLVTVLTVAAGLTGCSGNGGEAGAGGHKASESSARSPFEEDTRSSSPGDTGQVPPPTRTPARP